MSKCYNESEFYRAAKAFVEEHKEEKLFLYAVEIENFHIYNLWYGHESGEAYSTDVGRILAECMQRFGGIAGHISGPSFVCLLPNGDQVVNDVQEEISERNKHGEECAGFFTIIGIYHVSDPTLPIEMMYDRAVIALDALRGNYAMRSIHYNPDMDRELDEEVRMLADIRRGLKEDEFTFFIQPKCDMRSGKILGGEALVRWIHKEEGMISPGKFIPILEKSGFTVIVDQVIWEKVIAWQRDRLNAGLRPIPVSFNISRTDLFAIDVPSKLIELCEKYDIPHALVELEITESAYAEYFNEIKSTVQRLSDAGFPMLMDDFGSGYSSLNMLRSMNFDILKFDMKFLRSSEEERTRGLEILESVVNMARLLIVPVIIEGVETQEQVEYLTEMGCRYAQGYFYYKPMPVAEFEELLSDPSNVSYDGYVSKRVEQVHMREFLEDIPSTEMMINNMMGPVGFYEQFEDHIEIIRVNEPYFNLFGEGSSESITVIREHTSPEDYAYIKKLFQKAADQPMRGATGTFHYRRETGEPLWVLMRIFYLHERSGHKRFYGSLTDLSTLEKKTGT